MLALLIPFSILAIVIFLIVGIMQGKSTEKKSSIIRSVYFYLTSLVTLAIVVGSSVFLLNVVFKNWVFPDAESVNYRIGQPSTLFIVDEGDGRIEPILNTITCEDECSLTAIQKDNIKSWATEYKIWQESKDNPMANIYDELAAALSFLIVALPFFIIHFRIVQKDARKEEDKEKQVIRPTYFYFVSLAALLMIVIAGGILINTALTTWVFPESNNNNDHMEISKAYSGANDKAIVQSLIDCGEKCEIDEETITLTGQWIVDYEEWENNDYSYDNSQRDAAAAIPYIILGIPLFWYHWNIARSRKKKNNKEDINN